jgi:hypothetical protein
MADAAAIDKTIKDMAHQLETSSMDLKAEKELVREMKKLGYVPTPTSMYTHSVPVRTA